MATSTEIKQRANALADKTDVNSITPKEVGGIMYDLASHGENVLRNGGTLGIRKVYESVAAMEADSTNPKDFWGDPIKKGNLVVIYDGTTTGVDNNKIYAFMKPGWELATKLDAAYATKAETDAKLAELSEEISGLRTETDQKLSETSEEISGLRTETDQKLSELGSEKRDISLGVNIVNPKGIVTKSAIRMTGEIATGLGEHYAVSDFIPVNGKNIVSNGWRDSSGGWATYAVYDAEKVFLRAIGNNRQYVYESGDAFIRISFQDNVNVSMANYGTELATYQPYTQNYDLESKITEIQSNSENILSVLSPYESLLVGYYSNDGGFNSSDSYRYKKIGTKDLKGVKSIFIQIKFPAPVFCIQLWGKDNTLIKGYNTSSADDLFTKELLAEDWQGAEYIIIQTYSKESSEYDFVLKIIYKDVSSEIKALIPTSNNVISVGNGSYEEIQDAINTITNDSEDNPYLIVVYPGIYKPFYLTKQRARYISIVGLDKFNTKIVCTSGKYADATTIKHLYGSIKNLTFISNYDDFASESDYVSWINTSGNNGAYALHIDGSINSISQKLIVDNCILKSKCNATIGIGLHQDEVLEITNCSVYYEGTEAVATRFDRGAFYCHSYPISSADETIVNNQNLILANNRFYGKSGVNNPLYLAEIEYMSNDQGYCNFEFYNNMFIPNGVERAKQVNLKTTYGTKDFGHYINSASCGNNVKTLNKDIFEQ